MKSKIETIKFIGGPLDGQTKQIPEGIKYWRVEEPDYLTQDEIQGPPSPNGPDHTIIHLYQRQGKVMAIESINTNP